MGGTALLIYGDLSDDRLRPRPVPRTWLDRLLGRTREQGPRVRPLARGGELLSAETAGLEPLLARYRTFLAREIPAPHEASAQIFEYLGMRGIPSLYLRGEREAGGTAAWYTQIGFSGCSGMAEVSAAVAVHWAEAWVRRELPGLEREILGPFGFTPTPGQQFDGGDRFLPVEELGYLRWLPEADRNADGLVFEADHAVVEAIENTPERLQELSARHETLMADRRCLCQLCAPAQAPVATG